MLTQIVLLLLPARMTGEQRFVKYWDTDFSLFYGQVASVGSVRGVDAAMAD